MNMEKIFSYGTLQDPKVQQRLFNRTILGMPDVLVDYEITSVTSQGETFNCADFKVGKRIRGIVYEISKEELTRVDSYELKEYKRIKTTLLSGTQSWVYVRR